MQKKILQAAEPVKKLWVGVLCCLMGIYGGPVTESVTSDCHRQSMVSGD